MGRKRFLGAAEAFRKITSGTELRRGAARALLDRARRSTGGGVREGHQEFETFLSSIRATRSPISCSTGPWPTTPAQAIEQDQGLTASRSSSSRSWSRSIRQRYATDALGKIDVCRGKLAQKELWVAGYYSTRQHGGAGRGWSS